MKNLDIRNAIEQANIKYWEVAEEYGVNDGNFSRKLRKELSKEQKERIFTIIAKIKNERKG